MRGVLQFSRGKQTKKGRSLSLNPSSPKSGRSKQTERGRKGEKSRQEVLRKLREKTGA